MALEDALSKLTAAVERNTSLLEQMMAKAGTATGGAKADTAGQKAAEATAKAAEKVASGQKPTKTKVPNEEAIRAAFGEYMGTKDKAERETRKANVKAILDHFGVSRAGEIPEESRAEALEYVRQFSAGETPNFMAENDDGDGDGDDGLI